MNNRKRKAAQPCRYMAEADVSVGMVPSADDMAYYFHYTDCPLCDGGRKGDICSLCSGSGLVGLRPLEEVEIVAIEKKLKPRFGEMPKPGHISAMRREPKAGDRSALELARRS